MERLLEVSEVRSIKLSYIGVALLLILLLCPAMVFAHESVGTVGFANKYYTVSFNSMGGTSVGSIENVPHGAFITEPTQPKKSGEVFAGWYKSLEAGTKWDFITDTVTGNAVLYAKWESSAVSSEPETSKIDPPSSSQPPPASSQQPPPSSSSPPPASSSSTPPPASSSSGSRAPSSSSTSRSGGGTVTPPGGEPGTPPGGEGAGGTVTPAGTRPPATSSAASAASGDTAQPEEEVLDIGVEDPTFVNIGDTQVPLFGGRNVWSLISLISVILGLVLAVMLVIKYLLNLRDESEITKKQTVFTLTGTITSIVAMIVFFLVSDLRHTMVLFDKWTVLMILFLAVEVVSILFSRLRFKQEEPPREDPLAL